MKQILNLDGKLPNVVFVPPTQVKAAHLTADLVRQAFGCKDVILDWRPDHPLQPNTLAFTQAQDAPTAFTYEEVMEAIHNQPELNLETPMPEDNKIIVPAERHEAYINARRLEASAQDTLRLAFKEGQNLLLEAALINQAWWEEMANAYGLDIKSVVYSAYMTEAGELVIEKQDNPPQNQEG